MLQNVVTRIRKRLPGRIMSIFLTVVATFVGVVRYDAYQIKQIQDEFAERLREVRERPVQSGESIPSILVVVSPPVGHGEAGILRAAFKDHVKPGE